MVFLVLISLLLGSQPHQNDPLINQAREQAQYYLNQIQEGQNRDMHLWALTSLCENEQQPELLEFINSETSRIDFFKTMEGRFCDDKSKAQRFRDLALYTGSPNLILAAVLEEDDANVEDAIYAEFKQTKKISESNAVDYDSIVNSIINSDSITVDSLPVDQFYFPHFLLFFNTEIISNQIITPYYIRQATHTWFDQNNSFKNSTLLNSLKLTTILRGFYILNEYSEIHQLFPDLNREVLFPISEIRLRVYRYLDFSMHRVGRYDRSLDVLRNHSLPLAKFQNFQQEELSILLTQGVYLYQIGKIQRAQEIYQEVMNRSQEQNIDINESSLYNNLSITYAKSGNFDEYLKFQFRALKLAESQNNYSHQLDILRNLHVTYRRRGDQQSAQRYINEALKLAKRYDNPEVLGSIYISMGVFFRDLKSKPDSAAIYFDQAQSVINSEENFYKYIALLKEKAILYEANDDFEKALHIYDETQKIASSKNNSSAYLEALNDEARILLKLGEISKVGKILTELDSSDLSLLDFPEIVKAKTLEANYLVKTGQHSEAYEILQPAIEQLIERAQSSTDLQSGFWNIEQEYLNAFELYVELLIETDRPEEAVLALDQLKTINDAALYQNPMVKSTRLNESELTQYQQLTNQLDQLRKQQMSASSNKRLQLQSRIDRLNAQKRTLDRKISQFADQPPVNLHQIQQRLSARDLILHITELKDTYYVAKISRRKVSFQNIALNESTRTLFEQSILELSQGETNLNKLHQIGKLLDISELPATTENIILIPDSYLFQLPLDILPMEEPSTSYSYGESDYVIEKYRTEYLTSLKELVHGPETEKTFTWNYVGFGITDFNNIGSTLMSLPYADREVTQISRELSNLEHHRTILGEKSTEQAFRETAPNARILHLATHSTVSEQDPLFSRIYMSSPADQTTEQEQFESQIFAYELFEMNLSNDLIMLNSCESGSGSYLQGSGIVGISRALRYAGAESLVLNLWSVNDMMAFDFATQFYRALNQGDKKPEALRKAKVHFLKQKNANPHYWGPYMLIGSNRAVVKPHQSANILFASGFMAYLMLMVGLSYVVQKRRNI